eukprot:15451865-Alexandrium_andersonii.AAC.1
MHLWRGPKAGWGQFQRSATAGNILKDYWGNAVRLPWGHARGGKSLQKPEFARLRARVCECLGARASECHCLR